MPLMRVGDRWEITIPGELAFGAKGRPASPGKPRIPPNAPLDYEIFMEGFPGQEREILELRDLEDFEGGA